MRLKILYRDKRVTIHTDHTKTVYDNLSMKSTAPWEPSQQGSMVHHMSISNSINNDYKAHDPILEAAKKGMNSDQKAQQPRQLSGKTTSHLKKPKQTARWQQANKSLSQTVTST